MTVNLKTLPVPDDPRGVLREVPAGLRERWFEHIGPDVWRLSEEVRQTVRFRRDHLLDDPPPRERDLVLCRYLAFTYFTARRRRLAVERLATALREGGALVLGAKEDPGSSLDGFFEPWPDAPGVYRRELRIYPPGYDKGPQGVEESCR